MESTEYSERAYEWLPVEDKAYNVEDVLALVQQNILHTSENVDRDRSHEWLAFLHRSGKHRRWFP